MANRNTLNGISNYNRIDGIMIVQEDGTILYSALVSEDHTNLEPEPIIGMSLFEAYPSLNEKNSTHSRVIRSGKPVINEIQTTIDYKGRRETMLTSTFPLKSDGRVIATVDISTVARGDDAARKGKKLSTTDDIIAVDTKMKELKERISKVAMSDSAVMIVGESGTGKQLVAESLHTQSNRCRKPFISINCSAIPDTLLDSTLFGTVKGSFTGSENKKGVFEMADGGTLFLDEANSMSLQLQSKLLKAVEEKCYYKVGGETPISVNVRIISAMNREPEDVIKEGLFRLDLFYRLGVIKLKIPPLRERKDDILLIAESFIKRYNHSMARKIKGISDLAVSSMLQYEWPGNIRELKNAIEYAFHVGEGDIIGIAELPDNIISQRYTYEKRMCGLKTEEKIGRLDEDGLNAVVAIYEKKLMIELLKDSKTLSHAAKRAKLTRQALKYKIEKYDLDYEKLLNTDLNTDR